MSLKDAALVAPDVSSERKFFLSHEVTCHMAAIYWAFRTVGKSARDSASGLRRITASLCAGCQNPGNNHGSLNPVGYARLFCAASHALDDTCMVGDVIVTPDPRLPMHSMVVVDKPAPGTFMIRGFNNTGTFPNGVPPPPYMKYDPTTRDLADRVNGHNPNAHCIRSMTYIRAALTALAGAG